MSSISRALQSSLKRQWASFSYVGLVVATLFFAASLTPSLLPRHHLVQGLLSGFALAAGYGVGVALVLLWHYLELPRPGARLQSHSKRVTTVVVAIVAAVFLWRDAVWQNSIRQLMEMEPIESGYPLEVASIAVATGLLLISVARVLGWLWGSIHRGVSRVVPRRVSYVLTTFFVLLAVVLFVNDVVARLALRFADSIFLQLDMAVDEGLERPTDPLISGSTESLIDWSTIGRQGKNFILGGPAQNEIRDFLGRDALQPLRVYVGLGSRETMPERAQLALEELKRVGGFDRSVLIVATPTGTGWLDPGAVDTVEYMHAGDTAIVSMQYSYLPSWITILVDPRRSRESATHLFDVIYEHWKSLPRESRPRLYLHGLSLGSLGSEACADLVTLFEDPIQGAVWSGPPFPSTAWARATASRQPGSPMWLPRIRDGRILRFTGQENALDRAGSSWGPMRFVYIQYASDPMVFFSPDLLYRKPGWLTGERGPDVSPYLRWWPIVTFLQVGFDLPMATAVPTGYGHNYAPRNYIDAWEAVTEPPNWSEKDSQRLKQLDLKPPAIMSP